MFLSQSKFISEKNFEKDISTIWSLLKKNKSDSLVYRRVKELGYGCYIGYWHEGSKEPSIIINFTGGLILNSKEFKNLSISQKILSKNKSRIIIKPINKNHFKVFEKYMPLFLINNSKDLLNGSQIKTILNEIKEFSKLISLRKNNMSKEQIKGMIGELIFMRDLINTADFKIIDIIEAWQKNGNKHNDFVFANKEYEIKTSENVDQKSVHISSEFQLFSFNRSKVFLTYYGIKKTKGGISLDDLVSDIKYLFKDQKIALLQFSKKLITNGYFSCDFSKNLYFSEVLRHTFEINKIFPKLTIDEIPRNISEVRYKLNLPKIN